MLIDRKIETADSEPIVLLSQELGNYQQRRTDIPIIDLDEALALLRAKPEDGTRRYIYTENVPAALIIVECPDDKFNRMYLFLIPHDLVNEMKDNHLLYQASGEDEVSRKKYYLKDKSVN